jgi:hypothetical protein
VNIVQTVQLSRPSRRIAGLLLLALVTVEFGGYFLVRVASGGEQLTDFQVAFARAGHAHAGVLIVLSLVCLILADATELPGAMGYLVRLAIPAAAILMSAGFFLSSAGEGLTEPNGLIVVLWLGAAALTVGVVGLGVALLSGLRRGSGMPAARADTAP